MTGLRWQSKKRHGGQRSDAAAQKCNKNPIHVVDLGNKSCSLSTRRKCSLESEHDVDWLTGDLLIAAPFKARLRRPLCIRKSHSYINVSTMTSRSCGSNSLTTLTSLRLMNSSLGKKPSPETVFETNAIGIDAFAEDSLNFRTFTSALNF